MTREEVRAALMNNDFVRNIVKEQVEKINREGVPGMTVVGFEPKKLEVTEERIAQAVDQLLDEGLGLEGCKVLLNELKTKESAPATNPVSQSKDEQSI
ncbi:MAG: hypothetical protein FWE45_03540 [Firmicutes bacterium]|nr:hypothetical protein [Bacillota bacterium]